MMAALMLISAVAVGAETKKVTYVKSTRFTAVEASVFNMVLIPTDEQVSKVVIEGTERAVSHFDARIENGKLITDIKSKGERRLEFRSSDATVTIYYNGPLTEIEAKSGATVTATKLRGDDLKLEAEMGAELTVADVEAGNVKLQAEGGATLKAKVKAASVEAEAETGASMELTVAGARSIRAEAEGGASLTLGYDRTETLRLEAETAGTLKAEGEQAATLTAKAEGGASLTVKQTKGRSATLTAETASTIRMTNNATDLKVRATAGAQVVLAGTYSRADLAAETAASVDARKAKTESCNTRADLGAEVMR